MKNIKLFALGLSSLFFMNIIPSGHANETDWSEEYMKSWAMAPSSTSVTQKAKKIKIALLLDTSNSMDGLIEQAKSQLWNIVNELSQAKANGISPDLQIAVYQYGNSGLSAGKGFIRQEYPFTHDLDMVSEKLFSLSTNGGDEYCGQAIYQSLNELNWGTDAADYKTIFIAGNEPFDQGGVQPSVALNLAKSTDVFVNTIYCGDYQDGLSSGWNASAKASIGGFMNINSDQKTAYIATPYDDKINQLNSKLNDTYVRYGENGLAAWNNMNVQDNNAAQYGKANEVNRALTKNGNFYNNRNGSWDMVDRLNTDPNFKVKSVDPKTLPEEMQKMTPDQREKYVMAKKRQRANINAQIAELGNLRTAYISSERAKGGEDASLENAIVSSIQAQAKQKGFSFANDITVGAADPEFVPSLVDFDYFLKIAQEAKDHRADRLVDFNTFLAMADQPETIILDTRSKEHYDAMHIKGAIHLNYSAFNVYDLARLIPNKNTRILIYCNNNIDTDTEAGFSNLPSEEVKMEIQRNLVSKSGTRLSLSNEKVLQVAGNEYSGVDLDPGKTLALNIPTYINLYGYGYQNVYELNQLLRPNDPRLVLEGNAIPLSWSLR